MDQPVIGLRERGKAERWRRILETARLMFREQGYEATSVRSIAARAEVGNGTVFSYVRDKRELLAQVFDADLEALTSTAMATMPDGAPLLDQLLHLLTPRYIYWAAEPAVSRVAAQDSFGATAAERSKYQGAGLFHQRRLRNAAIIGDLARRHQEAGDLRSDVDAGLLGLLFMDIYIGAMRRWLTLDQPDPSDGVEELRQLLTIAIEGAKSAR